MDGRGLAAPGPIAKTQSEGRMAVTLHMDMDMSMSGDRAMIYQLDHISQWRTVSSLTIKSPPSGRRGAERLGTSSVEGAACGREALGGKDGPSHEGGNGREGVKTAWFAIV